MQGLSTIWYSSVTQPSQYSLYETWTCHYKDEGGSRYFSFVYFQYS